MKKGKRMEIIRKNYNKIIAIALSVLSFLRIIVYCCLGCVYIPDNDCMFFSAQMVFYILICIFGVKLRHIQGKVSQKWGKAMGIVILASAVTTTISVNANNNVFALFDACGIWLFLIQLTVGFILSIANIKALWGKTLIAAICFFVIVPLFALAELAAFIQCNFNGIAVRQTIASPGGVYEVNVVDIDQGALGGDTVIFAGKIKRTDLIFGCIAGEKKRIWMGEWGETPDIMVKDDKTVVICGKEYEI